MRNSCRMTLDKIAPGEKVARERGIKVEEKCGGSRKEGRKEGRREGKRRG